MESETLTLIPLLLGILGGLLALAAGIYYGRRGVTTARRRADELLEDARADAENRRKEILVSAQERMLARQEEAEARERELEQRELGVEERRRRVERDTSETGRRRKELERSEKKLDKQQRQVAEALRRAEERLSGAERTLEQTASLTREEARAQIVESVEQAAHADAGRLTRKIEDEAREAAERRAKHLMIQASQRVSINDVVESTVSFLELPSDEMKGRIIGREGRNIRALEMATGIDLVVDDTPRSILISSFDPVRREIARVAINRLVEDGRIHPARIEEVVQRAAEEIDSVIDERGGEAAFGVGVSDLHPRLVRLVGRMRYHTSHGQNLLQHCRETAMIAGHMARETGARDEVVQRAGLLHEIGQVQQGNGEAVLASAELCRKYGESPEVIETLRSLHPDLEARTIESMLLRAANRISESRPGARKENLAAFIERLRRLERIAVGFSGVDRAFAIKAGKEIRVIVNAAEIGDHEVYGLCKKIARTLERELSYPGQIKVGVVRETRAVRYAV